jgi:hypothetical protein
MEAAGTIPRPLTGGEKTLLRSVFAGTLSYDDQYVGRNDGEVGGPWNSYTPGYLPNMAVRLWSWDYSRGSPVDAAVFVHEMVHVWQSGHEIAIDALVGRDLGVALDHRSLDFDGAADRIDDAAEFDDAAVASALNDAAMMHRDGRVDQVAPQRP